MVSITTSRCSSRLKMVAKRLRPFAILLLVCVVVVVGIYVRIDNAWQSQQIAELSHYQGQPLLTAADGYLYLSLVRDLQNDTYSAINNLRIFPESIRRPFPPPLLVLFTYALAMTGWDILWIACFMPVFMGLLVIIPCCWLGYRLADFTTGVIASACILLAPVYLSRTEFGWYDTDCLILFFLLLISCLLLEFGIQKGARRYLFMFLSFITALVFAWWWNHAVEVVFLFFVASALCSALALYRPSRREGFIFAGIVMVAFVCVCLYNGGELIDNGRDIVASRYAYVFDLQDSTFPNDSSYVSEQTDVGILKIAESVTLVPLVLLVSLAGFLLLVRDSPRRSVVLFPLAGLCIISFWAYRFAIFIPPLSGLGVGYLAAYLTRCARKRLCFRIALLPVLFFCMLVYIGALIWHGTNSLTIPCIPAHTVSGICATQRLTEKDAVIWAWWDYGNAINFWAERATVSDGSAHSSGFAIFTGVPFAVFNQRLAANFIKFYVRHGRDGVGYFATATDLEYWDAFEKLTALLCAGPEDAKVILDAFRFNEIKTEHTREEWLQFLFPEEVRPTYLFLDHRLTETRKSWTEQGMQYWAKNSLEDRSDASIYERMSVFDQLFWHQNFNPRFFMPIRLKSPSHQLWRVKGDVCSIVERN